jgi:hypothetical protein
MKTNKTKLVPQRNNVVVVTIQEMYTQWIACHVDLFMEDYEFWKSQNEDFIKGMTALGERKMDAVRQMFRDGSTAFLVNMSLIDLPGGIVTRKIEPIELRILDEESGKLLAVIVDSDISY